MTGRLLLCAVLLCVCIGHACARPTLTRSRASQSLHSSSHTPLSPSSSSHGPFLTRGEQLHHLRFPPVPPHGLPSDPAPAQFFTQRLDHFDRSNPATWQQRYYVNASLWNGTGPVMFLIGHELAMNPGLVAGTWVINSLAEHFGGLIVCLEHRFFGASTPNQDESLSQLRFQGSEQALEDAANWVGHINAQYKVPTSSKWIVMGRSYGGTLAATFRSKYPHLVAGALATSGPIQAMADFAGYHEVVGQALGPKCNASLKAANDKVTSLLSTTAGQAQLAKDFNLCQPVSDPLEQALLVSRWADDVDETVQYAQPGEVSKWCDAFLAAGKGDPYQALIELYFPQSSPDAACTPVPSWTRYVEELQMPGDGRSWTYETCAEFGWYQTGSSPIQPISPLLNVNFSLRLCEDAYNISAATVLDNIAQTNAHYGGFGIQASHVLYSNGQLDPWHRAAVYPPNKGGEDNVVYLIEGASHCMDFMPPSVNDSASLKKLRGIQVDSIAKWIA